jgi:hypothetical protein
MFLRIWQFITIILAALTMGSAYCHALELPAKEFSVFVETSTKQ